MLVRLSLALLAGTILIGCADDPDDAATSTTSLPSGTSVPPATAIASGTAGETAVTIPAGVLAAMPFQNRVDVAKGLFQVKLYNGTNDDYDVVRVRFVWEGLTSPPSDRSNPLAAGDRLDYPVLLAPANCVGDHTLASMPDPQDAVVEVTLRDGRVLEVPVFDVKRFAQRLYLEDCERQHVETQVRLEWADLREADLDGRPVTDGVLRVSRAEATGSVSVLSIGNTINFGVELLGPAAGDAVVAVLAADDEQIDVPVRFAEGRCDAHASAESSQPFAFVIVLDLGDGAAERPYVLTPPQSEQVPMRRRLDRACDLLGTSGFVGEGGADEVPVTTTGT